MPRKSRIEFPGAIYHVIGRGNYRKDLFTQGRSGEAFEAALFEACERCGWLLHAYVVMSKHYHLALQTPVPKLVDGLKWLQVASQLASTACAANGATCSRGATRRR